jgi:DNA-binding NtrC family response regulator
VHVTYRALIAEDDRDMANLLGGLVEEAGFRAVLAHDAGTALAELQRGVPDVLLTDLRLPDRDGLTVLRCAHAQDATVQSVVITGYATVSAVTESFRLGARDLITKPFDLEQVRTVLARVRAVLDERTRVARLSARLAQLDSRVITPAIHSAAMRETMALVEQVAPLDVLVLLEGETGTGKAVIARLLHELSRRRNGPFFTVNCGAIAGSVMESELFGYEPGAFTGARGRKRGLLELGDGGTLLLDELNSAEPGIQIRLLQFIQDRALIRVGGQAPIEVDVRLVCACNEPLGELAQAGRFRRDLLFRLNVFPIRLPPLRDRREDIPALAECFLLKYARELDRPARVLSRAATERLEAYAWPGNVRELENVVQRAVVLCRGDVIGVEHLPAELRARPAELPVPDTGWPLAPDSSLAEVERFWIRHMLDRCSGNKTEAARRLGIDVSTLHRRLR